MRIFFVLLSTLMFTISVCAEEYEKACPTCDFVIVESSSHVNNCVDYYKYFFKNKKIGKAYEEFSAYFVPNHKYAEFWKRYLPDSNEKYFVKKEYVDNSTVTVFYEIIPKKFLKEGKKANIDMVVNDEEYYLQLREISGGTEIALCYSVVK